MSFLKPDTRHNSSSESTPSTPKSGTLSIKDKEKYQYLTLPQLLEAEEYLDKKLSYDISKMKKDFERDMSILRSIMKN